MDSLYNILSQSAILNSICGFRMFIQIYIFIKFYFQLKFNYVIF